MDLPPPAIQQLRQQRLERSGFYPIHSEEDGLRFIEDVGFCRFSHHGEVDLPCFVDALAPEVKEEYWSWKDSLPNTRRVYYGSIFHFHATDAVRPGFLALRMLAACYALSAVVQFGGDRSQLPRWTGLSREALALADTLERDGALPTKELRKAASLDGKANATKFNKALIEAQRGFLIVRTGVTSTTRANYGYIWESFPRAFPLVAAQAESLTEIDAASAVLSQYIDTAVTATVERIAFVLTLDLPLLRSAADRLIQAGELTRDAEGSLCLDIHLRQSA